MRAPQLTREPGGGFPSATCAGPLAAALAVLALTVSVHAAAAIDGLATLSGAVTSETPFQAAQVYAWNRDKNMLYTVFTLRGKYRAVNLMPGGYEIWAEWDELRSEHVMVRIQGAATVTIDLVLKAGPAFPLTLKTRVDPGVAQLSYDEMYPPGPGRAMLEEKCMACHGQAFFPARHMTEAQWDYMIGQMLNPDATTRLLGQRGAMITGEGSVGGLTDAQRKTLAEYLAAHFGADSPARSNQQAAIGIFYPDVSSMTGYGAFR